MEFHKCSANAVCLQSNHRVTMHGDDGSDKSDSLSVVVIVDLSQMWSMRRQENSASVLPIGKTARIFSSSRSCNGCNGFIWLSFLPLPMIRPAKQLTFKRRRKRKNMLPFLFQNVEKASHSVFIFFANYLWHEGTKLIMSSLFVAETGLQFQ